MDNFNCTDSYVYILVRTTINQKHDHFKAMIESVSKQNYPRLKLLLLVDTYNGNLVNTSKSLDILKSYDIDVIVISADCGNSSKALLKLREYFCSIAKPYDIAIQLDDDDELAVDAVSLIVSKMVSNRADICMIGYIEGNDNVTSIIKDQNKYYKLLSEIEALNGECNFKTISHLYLAATMGWTKCYNQKTLNRLCEMIKECDAKREREGRLRYIDIATCEDFVDFCTLLLRDTSITAISEPLYIYKRHVNSVTFSLNPESFRIDRIGFLRYLQELVHNNMGCQFDNIVSSMISQFIKYKISVIAKILEGRYKEYTMDNLFADLNINNPYMESISKEDAFALHDSIV